MPIKRSELYWTSFIAGMILMFIPLILTTGILIFYGKTIPLYYRELSINHCLSWFLIQSALNSLRMALHNSVVLSRVISIHIVY